MEARDGYKNLRMILNSAAEPWYNAEVGVQGFATML